MAARPRAIILVLEDITVLTMDIVDCVEQAGCEAVEVQDTAEAIAILEARTDVRVVITDLDVRGAVMGMELAALIRNRWPPIHLILTSSEPVPPAVDQLPVESVYLGKPFHGSALVAAINGFLAEGR